MFRVLIGKTPSATGGLGVRNCARVNQYHLDSKPYANLSKTPGNLETEPWTPNELSSCILLLAFDI